MSKLVKLKFHGSDWDIPTDWNLNVKSVGEAIRAVETNTQKLYGELINKDKKNVRYCVVINGRNFKTEQNIDEMSIKDVKNTELAIETDNLETIDIIPVFEGADSDALGIFTAILGVVLVVVGIILSPAGIGAAVLVAGIGLIAAGVFALLSKPPAFEDFREIEQGGKTSYLFSGPQNIIGEGGPVPVGYGRLIVGSQVISAAFTVTDHDIYDTSNIVRNEYEKLNFIPLPPDDTTDYSAYDYDSDTSAFISAAGISNYTNSVKVALDTLVRAFKAAGVWDKILAFYPFVGATEESHRYNLKGASYTITWNNSTQSNHSSLGVLGESKENGLYGDTNLKPYTAGMDEDSHIYVYNRTKQLRYGRLMSAYDAQGGGNKDDFLGMACWRNQDGNTPTTYVGIDGISNNFQNTFLVKGNAHQAGHIMFGRSSATSVYCMGLNTPYIARTTSYFDTAGKFAWQDYPSTATTAPDENLYLLTVNNNGTVGTAATSYSNANLAAASIGKAFNQTEAEAFMAAVQAFQSTLGRAV